MRVGTFMWIGWKSSETPTPKSPSCDVWPEWKLAILANTSFAAMASGTLCIDVGADYRVYYAIAGKKIVLLLCGGDKRTQDADIDRACEYWRDWQA